VALPRHERGPSTTAIGCESILQVPTVWQVVSAHFLIHSGNSELARMFAPGAVSSRGYACRARAVIDGHVIADRLQLHLAIVLALRKLKRISGRLVCVFDERGCCRCVRSGSAVARQCRRQSCIGPAWMPLADVVGSDQGLVVKAGGRENAGTQR
jgi:hypothetical protein